jgi:hypothetical protein
VRVNKFLYFYLTLISRDLDLHLARQLNLPWRLFVLCYIKIHYCIYTRKWISYFINWPLTPERNPGLCHRDLNFSPQYGKYLSRVILKSLYAWRSYASDTGFSLSPKCYLDLLAVDLCFSGSPHPIMVIICTKLFCNPSKNELDIDRINPNGRTCGRTFARTDARTYTELYAKSDD